MDDATPDAADSAAAPPADSPFDDLSTVPLDYEEWGPPDPDLPDLPEPPPLRYSGDEVRRMGDAYFEREVRAAVADEPPRRFVALDVEGRGWEVADRAVDASIGLRRRVPDAQIWLRRVGPDPVARLLWYPGSVDGTPPGIPRRNLQP